MFNNVIIIGRLTEKPSLKTIDETIKVCNVTLAVGRPFKHQEGQYDVDFIPVSLWYSAAINTAQYCEKGDAICVKGRLVQKVQEINGINYHFIEMVGERVVFLSSKNKAEDLIEDKCVETA